MVSDATFLSCVRNIIVTKLRDSCVFRAMLTSVFRKRHSRFLRNTRTCLPQCIASHPRKLYSPNIYYCSHGDSLPCTCLIQLNFPMYVTCLRFVNSSLYIYRVIHKSLRDFRTRLRNNQDRHGRKDHINR